MVTLLFTPIMIWINQTVVFLFIQPLFPTSILKHNVLDALRIVIFNSPKSTVFIQSEVNHLRDVHVLLVFFYLIGIINLIMNWKFWRPIQPERKPARRSLLVSAAVIGLVSLVAGLFFDQFFELFHQVLFPQGNFAFPWNSMLIQTFPPEFWFLQFVELQAGVVILILLQAFGGRRNSSAQPKPQSPSAD